MSKQLATIGFGRKGLERFIDLLVQAGVQTVIDTRRRPDSTLAEYARQRDLPFALRRIAGIGYEHCQALAPSEELLKRFRMDRDWDAYVLEFEESVLSSEAGLESMATLLRRPDRVALMCSEPTPEQCHRRLVSERMAEMEPLLRIVHLV